MDNLCRSDTSRRPGAGRGVDLNVDHCAAGGNQRDMKNPRLPNAEGFPMPRRGRIEKPRQAQRQLALKGRVAMTDRPQVSPRHKTQNGTGGYIRIQRQMLDHPIVGARKPYSKCEAWMWMIAAAAWQDHDGIERGDLVHSIRFMAKSWGWSIGKTQRFLQRLIAAEMVRKTRSETDSLTDSAFWIFPSHLTICNYEQYQADRFKIFSQTDSLTDSNLIKGNANSKKLTTFAVEFDQFWNAWPNKVGKKKAMTAFHSILKSGNVNFDTLIEGAARYVRDKPPDRQWLNPATWLNQARWEDEPPPRISQRGNVVDMASVGKEMIDEARQRERNNGTGDNPMLNAPKPSGERDNPGITDESIRHGARELPGRDSR